MGLSIRDCLNKILNENIGSNIFANDEFSDFLQVSLLRDLKKIIIEYWYPCICGYESIPNRHYPICKIAKLTSECTWCFSASNGKHFGSCPFLHFGYVDDLS
jgi:hypothetical protein